MNLEVIENELKKRLNYPYKWGMRQNDYYDDLTNFIYKISYLQDLLDELERNHKNKEDYKKIFNYSLNRWYNFWSAIAVEHIFCSCNDVIPELDKKNKLIDFSIKGIKFDHKTTVYPSGYRVNYEIAKQNPIDLIKWLYKNQSKQKRFHTKNRLFIVLHSQTGEHWKLKSEIELIKTKIYAYVESFQPDKLFKLSLEKDEFTFSDIIWVEN